MPADKLTTMSAEYVETHKIFELFEQLVQQLVIERPDDPIEFMINELEKPQVPKIIIAGPPASGKGTQCEMIREKYGVVHLSTGDILREAVRSNSELGVEAKQYMDRGDLVPDKLVVDLVIAKLTGEECMTKGWLLDGFPRSKVQAEAMQQKGILPSKFVLLDCEDEVVIKRIVGRRVDPSTNQVYHVDFNPPPAEVVSRLVQRSDDTETAVVKRLAVYRKNLALVVARFTPFLKRIDAARAKDVVFADVDQFLNIDPPSRAPKTAIRMFLAGPPGAGKKTQAKKLADRFGCVIVSSGELLKTAVVHGTPLGNKAAPYIQDTELVPDSMVTSLVMERLQQADCRKRGWILEGYPRNAAQAQALLDKPFGLPAREVLVLKCSDEIVIDRLLNRKYDPTDGRCYHPKLDWPASQEVQDRLAKHPRDTEIRIRKRLNSWHANSEQVLEMLTNQKTAVRYVPGEGTEQTVFEHTMSYVSTHID